MSRVCVYHESDLDGIASAAIVKQYFKDVELSGTNNRSSIQKYLKYDEVILVDFSFDKELMIELNEKTNLTWFDHHKTAIEKMSDFDIKGIQRNGMGACLLVWAYYYGEEIPRAIRLLSLYDVYNKDGSENFEENVLPFQFYMRSLKPEPDDMEFWVHLFSDLGNMVDRFIESGRLIYHQLKKQWRDKMIKNAFEVTINERKFLAINEVLSSIAFKQHPRQEEYEGFLSFVYRGREDVFTFTMYSNRPNFDVSKIAVARGGGGHFGAAGFRDQELVWRKK